MSPSKPKKESVPLKPRRTAWSFLTFILVTFIASMTGGVTGLFLVGTILDMNYSTVTDQEIIDYGIGEEFDCSELSLEDTVYCLNNYVQNIFNYRQNSDLNKLTLKELQEIGGDCKDWNDFYSTTLNYYGFKTKEETILVEMDGLKQSQHIFLIVYDKTGYCLLDQLSLECLTYDRD
jgi:hypothetical protein